MADRLKILALTNTFPTEDDPGDTPAIKDQVDELRRRGIDVDLVLIRRTHRRKNYLGAAWKVLMTNFRQEHYDLIHAYYGLTGLLARLQFRSPVIVTFRGSDLLSGKDGPIGRRVARWVDGVIVMSDEMKRVSRRSDARVIPFGVNLDVFGPVPREQARRQLGLAVDGKLVLFPWDPRRPEKRFDVVRAAVDRLKTAGHDVELIVVYDQPRETIAQYMNACDVMALASDHEGSPMAVREAMACNLPIVSVDVGDVRQIIGEVEGCLLSERTPADMADKIGRVLQRDRRTNGRQVVKTMDAGASADQVIAVYRGVLARRRASDHHQAEERI